MTPQNNPDRLENLVSYKEDITSYEYTLWSVTVAVLHMDYTTNSRI